MRSAELRARLRGAARGLPPAWRALCAVCVTCAATAVAAAAPGTAPAPVVQAADGKPAEGGLAAAEPLPPAPPPLDPAVQRAFDAARQALAANRLADARRQFEALAAAHPELPGPLASLALIARREGRWSDAVAGFEQAVQRAPARADLYNQLGVSCRMAGRFDEARAAYEKAIALDPHYAAPVLNLGILHDLYLWDGERALQLYDRYLQLTPGGDDGVRRWISDLKNRSGRKNGAAAKEQG